MPYIEALQEDSKSNGDRDGANVAGDSQRENKQNQVQE